MTVWKHLHGKLNYAFLLRPFVFVWQQTQGFNNNIVTTECNGVLWGMNLAQNVQSFPKVRAIYHWCLPFIILNGNRRKFSKRHILTPVQFSSVHWYTEILGFFRRSPHKSSRRGSVFFRFVLKTKKRKGFDFNLHNFLLINQNNIREELKEILAILTELSYSVPFWQNQLGNHFYIANYFWNFYTPWTNPMD